MSADHADQQPGHQAQAGTRGLGIGPRWRLASRLQASGNRRHGRFTSSKERLGPRPCARHIQTGKMDAGLIGHLMPHYVAIVEDAGPEKAVGIWFPDLPGCFSAGDDIDAALRNAEEAL